jgi:hypothetical protein
MTDDDQPQRPEGELIQALLKKDGRSVRQVAPLAGLSEARWRQIVKGTMVVGGHPVDVVAPPATLARMAYILGVTPKTLTGVGRADAAEVLEHMQADERRSPPKGRATVGDEIDLIYASRTMDARQKLERIRMVLELRAQAEREEAALPQTTAPVEPAGADNNNNV